MSLAVEQGSSTEAQQWYSGEELSSTAANVLRDRIARGGIPLCDSDTRGRH